MAKIKIKSFFHSDTSTWSHVVTDSVSLKAAIIDPVLDFEQNNGHITTASADELLAYIEEQQLDLDYILETHAHADHLSAGDYLRTKTGAQIVIGKLITQVQSTFAKVYNEDSDFLTDGSQFDILLNEGEQLALGESLIRVIDTPGHTPACVSLLVNDKDVFIGDTLFMPDTGTARCDFPNGDAGILYDSIQKLFALDESVNMHLCHDYPPNGRTPVSVVTVAEQKAKNIHVRKGISREKFVRIRTERDATLAKPKLILPSLQVNIRAGALPKAEANGISYLKVPLNTL